MSETLKPCPFCGGEAVIEQGTDCWWVECFEIPCMASGSTREHRSDAIAAWNRRAEPEVLAEGFMTEHQINLGLRSKLTLVYLTPKGLKDIVPVAIIRREHATSMTEPDKGGKLGSIHREET